MRNVGQVPDKARVLVVFHKPLLLRPSYVPPIDRNKETEWEASGNNSNVIYKIYIMYYSKVIILITYLLVFTAQKLLVSISSAGNVHVF
jgi:hypothetical protein